MKTVAAVEVLLCLIYYRMDDGEAELCWFSGVSNVCIHMCGTGWL